MLARALPLFVALLAAALAAAAVPLVDAAAVEAVLRREASDEPLAERWAGDWSPTIDAALEAAEDPDRPVLVYARRDTAACRAFERAAGSDSVLAEVLGSFVLLALDLDGGSDERDLARTLGLDVAPTLVVYGPQAFRVFFDPSIPLSDHFPNAIVPSTGGLHEPFGLSASLEGFDPTAWESLQTWPGAHSDPPDADAVLSHVDFLEAAGRTGRAQELVDRALLGEPQPNGPIHRLARLRDAIRTHTVDGAPDNEGTIERALLIEDDPRILFRGWTLLASVFDLRARTADRATGGAGAGTYRGVDAVRWRRRMRSATREGWLSCPDELVLPYAALLIERYGQSIDDLDSADRIFCRAVLRTLRKEAPESPRLARAAEIVGSMR